MQPNKWINTQTRQEVGVNSVLGTPRSWVSRALGTRHLDPEAHTIDPKSITVGGLWYRPCRLPDLADHYAIYRFFELDPGFNGHGIGANPVPVLGVGVAVPADEILAWSRRFKLAGASWLWWNWPTDATDTIDLVAVCEAPPRRSKPENLRKNATLDHRKLYQLFNQGLDVDTVSKQLDLHKNSVRYVWDKWLMAKPITRSTPRVDRTGIIADLRAGIYTAKEIALRRDTTVVTVGKIRRQQGI